MIILKITLLGIDEFDSIFQMPLITIVQGQEVIGEFQDFLVIPMLSAGIINRDDLVWEEGMDSWETLESRFDIADCIPSPQQGLPPSPQQGLPPSPQQGLPPTSLTTDWMMKTKKTAWWRFLLGQNLMKKNQLDYVEKKR